ncbi:hypothetical protein H4R33_006739 [Dimargaris cristalligena]|uniref:Eukaryotic translation initiation factor 2A n=1 Tax=Dimargaris cristalligena TaxID=215637 RepID=A0A4P9ZQL2_9FUNG|nr:hypothetical protein H4R33_006739 [Dimargaris cristalligena]RKP35647.1 eukaryotic translation initiation factor eIF2A-domain-containing protein [Dimargaris cristalligena]|eukprot:RKP35647.1 eukaryotic translation initiation factor eIF2A-domain-containing protein [Dimargaris cristalligena]
MTKTQFAYRSLNEIGLVTGPPSLQDVVGFTKPTGNNRAIKYSPDGRLFAWASTTAVEVMDVASGQLLQTIARPNVMEIDFSPRGTYLLTWERYIKPESGPLPTNMLIWETTTGSQMGAFTRKLQSSWGFQWTPDEQYCAQLAPNEVQFFDPTNFGKGIHTRLSMDGIQSFSLSPGQSPSVAAFVPAQKGQPGHVRLYSIGNFRQPVCQKTFFKADSVKMIWNTLGTNLLILASTDVDLTGKSYYGETNLYYLTVAGNFDCHVVLDKEGPIHDVAWNPNPEIKEFAVVYGYMPARAALFDRRANLIHDFGTAPRNFIGFNPQGRLVAIAGFGNLTGQMDIWDLKTHKKRVTINASNSTTCEWSPDGRHLMTSTLSPRLRVDNGIKVWHHTGSLMFHRLIHELYQVAWRPLPVANYPDRSALSPPPPPCASGTGTNADAKTPTRSVASVGTYRPPHARGTMTPPSFKREDEIQRSNGKSSLSVDPSSPNAPDVSQMTETEKTTRIRNINKQLKQISALKKREEAGEHLEPEKLVKMQKEPALKLELKALKSKKPQ